MNYHSDDWIKLQLNNHWNEALNLYKSDNIIGLFVRGSQIYGLDTEGSDVDTRLLITPTRQSILDSESPISYNYTLPNGELICITEIRSFINFILNNQLIFIEALFSPYYILNPLYERDILELINLREELMKINPKLTVMAFADYARDKYNHLYDYPEQDCDYNRKHLHHLVRSKDIITKYSKGYSFEECLKPFDCDYLIKLKRCPFPTNEASNIADQALKDIEMIEKSFIDKDYKSNEDIKKSILNIGKNIISKSIVKELNTNG